MKNQLIHNKSTPVFFNIQSVIFVFLFTSFSLTFSQTDLVFTSIAVTDATGPNISWTATYKNQGNLAADGSKGVLYRFYITMSGFSQNIVGYRHLKLDAGESYTGSYKADLTGIPNNGKGYYYTLTAVIDPDNEYDELNENNNSLNASTRITLTDPSLKPKISSFTPESGSVNTEISISGSDFGDGTYKKISFGSTTAYILSWSNTKIVTKPYNLKPGKYTINVENWNGTGYSPSQFTVEAERTAYTGSPLTVPGKIEAEYYDIGANGKTYYDLSSGNTGGAFRSDDVDLEACTDDGGGYDVGWTETGEWVEYSINSSTSGTFTVAARVASAIDNGEISVKIDGGQKLTATVPNTGDWQNWQGITFGQVSITAGDHILRVTTENTGYNLNYIEIFSGTVDVTENKETPTDFTLEQNYPNPFNPTTTIKYSIPDNVIASNAKQSHFVSLKIFDLLGQDVATLVNEQQAPGIYEVKFEASDLPSGVYLYKLSVEDPSLNAEHFVSVKKLILLK